MKHKEATVNVKATQKKGVQIRLVRLIWTPFFGLLLHEPTSVSPRNRKLYKTWSFLFTWQQIPKWKCGTRSGLTSECHRNQFTSISGLILGRSAEINPRYSSDCMGFYAEAEISDKWRTLRFKRRLIRGNTTRAEVGPIHNQASLSTSGCEVLFWLQALELHPVFNLLS